MIEELDAALKVISDFLNDVDPATVFGSESLRIARFFIKMGRVASAGQASYAHEVHVSNNGTRPGDVDPFKWLADEGGVTSAEAAAEIAFGKQMNKHPEVAGALANGDISKAQAKEVLKVAELDPRATGKLVREAQETTLGEFRRSNKERIRAHMTEMDLLERERRLKRGRRLRTYLGDDGFGHLEALLHPVDLNRVTAALEPFRRQAFENARSQGDFCDNQQAYMADALVALVSGAVDAKKSPSGQKMTQDTKRTFVRIKVDLGALLRGETEPGETCSLIGFDEPLAVRKVRELIPESILELIVTKGVDVRTICTDSRYVSKALQAALDERDQSCAVPGCEVTYPLERHHLREVANDGPTSIANLVLICSRHHDLISFEHWTLVGAPGKWELIPPPGAGPPGRMNASQRPSRVGGRKKTKNSRSQTVLFG